MREKGQGSGSNLEREGGQGVGLRLGESGQGEWDRSGEREVRESGWD